MGKRLEKGSICCEGNMTTTQEPSIDIVTFPFDNFAFHHVQHTSIICRQGQHPKLDRTLKNTLKNLNIKIVAMKNSPW